MTETEHRAGPVAEHVTELVLPILRDLGIELYDCEHAGGIVRVTIQKAGGLDLDAVALVTRLLSRELDAVDPIPGKYTLEVSSPGLERVLRRPDHFQGAIGSTVAVRLTGRSEGVRRIQGTLVAADDSGITVRSDDAALTEHQVGYAQIERARTVFVWGPTPKPGGPRGPKPARTRPGASRAGGSDGDPAPVADATDESDPTTQEAGA